MTGEQIRARLTAFAARWSVYEGTERAEAQTFQNELFACYGTERGEVARFEEHGEGGFPDAIWPGVCVIEMKAPGEAKRLARHRVQAMRYWASSAEAARGIPAARWVVICAFRRLEIWEPGAFPGEPRAVLDLIDLPTSTTRCSFAPATSRCSPVARRRSRARLSSTSSTCTSN